MRRVFMAIAALFGLVLTSVDAKDRKPIVAVAEVKDLTKSGEDAALGAMIETALAGSSKFRVAARPRDPTKSPPARDATPQADFLIHATIAHETGKAKTDVGGTLGMAILGGLLGRREGERAEAQEPCTNCTPAETSARAAARSSASAAKSTVCRQVREPLEVDVRIVEPTNGKIAWASTIKVHRNVCVGTKHATSPDHLRSVADKVERGLTLAIHPIRVAAVEATGSILLNYGDDMLRVGDTLELSVPSKQCLAVDPDSGECLSQGVTVLGFVQVTEVMPRFSRASPVTQLADSSPVGAIARPAPLPRTRPVKRRPTP